MAAPQFTIANFTAAYQSLLPRGRVWPRDPDALQTNFVTALAATYQRQSDSLASLLIDAFPATTLQLLPEWESSLGLPDPCAGPSQTIQQRQKQVLTKFTSTGGQSANYFIALLARYGFSGITITTFAPFRAGFNRAGDPCNGEGWFFTWLISAPNLNVVFFRAGASTANEPLYALTGAAVLECVVKEFAPAHTYPLFAAQ